MTALRCLTAWTVTAAVRLRRNRPPSDNAGYMDVTPRDAWILTWSVACPLCGERVSVSDHTWTQIRHNDNGVHTTRSTPCDGRKAVS